MNHEKFVELIALYTKPQIYVELGAFQCSTFNIVAKHVTEWSYAVDIGNFSIHMESDSRRSFYTMSTEKFSKFWSRAIGKQIDLIFIDASHQKESVIEDVNNFLPFLRTTTGLMLLHDTWPLNKAQTHPGYSGDGYLAIKEIKKISGCEVLTIPIPYGITIIRKMGDDWRDVGGY